jgi:GTP cyclohydrolase IA
MDIYGLAVSDSAVNSDHSHDAQPPSRIRAEQNSPQHNTPISGRNLYFPSLGTYQRLEEGPIQSEERLQKMRSAVRMILECMGEDPDREGIIDTPSRYAEAMLSFTKGYQQDMTAVLNNAIFQERHSDMVVVKDIEIFSLCEHHLVPFIGKVSFLPPSCSQLSNLFLYRSGDAFKLTLNGI